MVDLIYNAKLVLVILTLLFPFIVFYLLSKKGNNWKIFLFSVVLSTLTMSSLIIFQWLALDYALEAIVTSLDTNQDGGWSTSEKNAFTQDDWRHFDLYFTDGGRNVFAVMLFPGFSLVYSLAIVSLYWFTQRFKRKKSTT